MNAIWSWQHSINMNCIYIVHHLYTQYTLIYIADLFMHKWCWKMHTFYGKHLVWETEGGVKIHHRSDSHRGEAKSKWWFSNWNRDEIFLKKLSIPCPGMYHQVMTLVTGSLISKYWISPQETRIYSGAAEEKLASSQCFLEPCHRVFHLALTEGS